MRKITYTRTVSNYEFSPPKLLNEIEYSYFKDRLNKDPNVQFFHQYNYQKKNNHLYLIAFISAICFVIGLIGTLNSEKSNWSFFLLIISLLVLFPLINGGRLQSAINQDNAENERSLYYSKLKKRIIESKNYSDFIKKEIEYQQFEFENKIRQMTPSNK